MSPVGLVLIVFKKGRFGWAGWRVVEKNERLPERLIERTSVSV